MLAFATDLHDEGLEVVLGNVQERAGVDGVTMAVAYHDARDVFPHNPVHKVRYLEGGAVFFNPTFRATTHALAPTHVAVDLHANRLLAGSIVSFPYGS